MPSTFISSLVYFVLIWVVFFFKLSRFSFFLSFPSIPPTSHSHWLLFPEPCSARSLFLFPPLPSAILREMSNCWISLFKAEGV